MKYLQTVFLTLLFTCSSAFAQSHLAPLPAPDRSLPLKVIDCATKTHHWSMIGFALVKENDGRYTLEGWRQGHHYFKPIESIEAEVFAKRTEKGCRLTAKGITGSLKLILDVTSTPNRRVIYDGSIQTTSFKINSVKARGKIAKNLHNDAFSSRKKPHLDNFMCEFGGYGRKESFDRSGWGREALEDFEECRR